MQHQFPTTALLCCVIATLACHDPAAPSTNTAWDNWPSMQTSISTSSVLTEGVEETTDSATGALRVSLRFRNTGFDSARVEHGACSFGIRLRAVNGKALMPISWDNRVEICTLQLLWFDVPPQSSRDRVVATLMPATLRGTVAPGEYHVYVTWRTLGRGPVWEHRAGSIVVPVR